MTLLHSNYNPDLKYGAVADESDLAITEGSMLIGNSSGLGVELDISAGGNILVGNDTTGVALDASDDAKIIVGNGTTVTSVAVSGDATMTNAGLISVTNFTRESGVVTASTEAILATDSGKVYFNNAGSATQTYTLPAVAAGLTYTFVLTNAGGEIIIDQAASEVITITTFAAVGADADTAIVAPAGGTGIKNTAATNAAGDSLTLVSDGTGWYGVGITGGIWASQ